MTATLNTTQLYSVLNLTPPHHNILLVGKHGIGKSQIVTEFFQARGLEVTTLFLGQMSDPGDLIGLPRINPANGKTEFVPPYWFPTDGKPIVLFLDELNRARPEMLQSVMDLVLNRKLAGRSLPHGSRIISAVNDGEEYQVDELDPALLSRFNIYEFQPAPAEWVAWARNNNLDHRVVDFIERNPKMLDGSFNADTDSFERFPDRRAWHRVAEILANVESPDLVTFRIVAGIVGSRAAAMLNQALAHKALNAKDVLCHFDDNNDSLGALTIAEFSHLNETIFNFLDSGSFSSNDTLKVVTNLCSYIQWLSHNHRNEALAHFINLFTLGTYANANKFIITKCPGLYRQFTSFVLAVKP